MKPFLLPVILLLFAASCGQKETSVAVKPDDLIPREKMVNLLADVHLLEAAIGITASNAPATIHMVRDPSVALPPANLEKQKELGYFDIFRRNGVTRKQYEGSMKWYSAHPEKLSTLYDDVITELTRRQTVEQTDAKKAQPQAPKAK